MSDKPPRPATRDEIAQTLSPALRYDGRRGVHHADDAMAVRLVEHLEPLGVRADEAARGEGAEGAVAKFGCRNRYRRLIFRAMSRRPLDPKHLPPAAWYDAWWHHPPDLLAVVSAHNAAVPEVDFFFQPKLKPLREAFAAAMFATIRTQSAACMVRLTLPEQEFPDFWLQLPGKIQPFELTEADREGRRRGDEYCQAAERASAGLSRQWAGYDPDEEAEAIILVIAKRIKQKAAKRYHPPPHLLVHVNPPLYGN